MKHNKIVKKFSKVLFEAALSADVLEEVNSSITSINQIIKSNKLLNTLLQSKRFSYDEKYEVLDQVLGGNIHSLVLGIICFIDGSSVHRVVADIKKDFRKKYMNSVNKVFVHAIVSDEESRETILKMKKNLDNALKKDSELTLEVDEKIIGGLKLRIENTFLDASIKNQMDNIKLELMRT